MPSLSLVGVKPWTLRGGVAKEPASGRIECVYIILRSVFTIQPPLVDCTCMTLILQVQRTALPKLLQSSGNV